MIDVKRWAAVDPEHGSQIASQASDDDWVERHFGGRLAFGTAGMRGPIGPGPRAMNVVMVRWVTAGLVSYLGEAEGPLVVGFDGRHGSKRFAAEVAAVASAAGREVYVFDAVCPTPRLAHAVLAMNAAAGVMVTASHNPPRDNGYKVYWGNGAQIVAPHDRGISDAIDAIAPDGVRFEANEALVHEMPKRLDDEYLEAVLAFRGEQPAREVSLVYTAMHGVGRLEIERVLGAAGYSVECVPEQADPDPDFPTVAFPNPEEPGALDLAIALARKVGADAVFANDPDADRLAVAVFHEGEVRVLSGNELGWLLGDYLLARGGEGKRLVACSVVSSTLLRSIAEHHGAAFLETLTGFKWIANGAMDWEAKTGGSFVFGYEEAIGYTVGPLVRDKDGVSAALAAADLVAECKAAGKTLVDRLEELAVRHGCYVSAQHAATFSGPDADAQRAALMDRLRENLPAEVGGCAVASVVDYATDDTGLPPANLVALLMEGGHRILVRPSGTEPKIKVYFETRAASHQAATDQLDALRAPMLEILKLST